MWCGVGWVVLPKYRKTNLISIVVKYILISSIIVTSRILPHTTMYKTDVHRHSLIHS